MAKNYSSAEIKNVSDRHRGLLNALEKTVSQRNNTAAQFRSLLDRLTLHDGFSQYIEDEMSDGTRAVYYPLDVENLKALLCRLRREDAAAETAQALLSANRSAITADLSALQSGGSGLRRMFASADKKARADEAYARLEELLRGDYAAQAQQACEVQVPDQSAVREEFDSNKEFYRSLTAEAVPGVFEKGGQTSVFKKITDKIDSINAPLEAAKTAVEQCTAQIKSCAAQMKAKEAMRVLREVPVDEVNRDKEGIRVKTLRDAGFNTMSDVHYASVQKLTDINGIGEEGAEKIKRIALEFAKQSVKTARIRLSEDDKSYEATNLVCAIYSIREYSAGVKAMEQLHEDYGINITAAKNILAAAGNGLSWVFYTDHDKNKSCNAYRFLQNLVAGDYPARVKEVASQLSGGAGSNAQAAWSDFSQNTVDYINILEEYMPDALGSENGVYGLPEDLAEQIADREVLTDGLSCTLRPYQTWGVKYILQQQRVLLGDEMGLGKTVQAIASMVSMRNSGKTHFMVVCPASVISNWCREVEKFSDLSVVKIHGSGRDKALSDWKSSGGAAVTTYETTGRITLDPDFKIGAVVVDEAHYIKNPEAARTKNVRALCDHAESVVFMTGTALENRVDEMIELVRVLRPEVAQQIKSMAFMTTAPQFRETIAPVYYRRKRADVLKELPEMTQSEEWCTQSADEEKAYEQAVLSKNYALVRRVSWLMDDVNASCKAQRLKEIAAEAESEQRKLIVFSFFLDTVTKVAQMFGDKCMGPINGSIPPARRQEIIDEFDKAAPGSVLAAQIQSGGTGLNIQSASVVVLCEPQFKPSIENQAVSRAYRMGQSRNVLVYRLLCENTVDEKIMKLLEQKQAVFNAFADDSKAADDTFELDQKGFGDIVQEEIERIVAKYGGYPQDGEESTEIRE